jgi:hypothetical protein
MTATITVTGRLRVKAAMERQRIEHYERAGDHAAALRHLGRMQDYVNTERVVREAMVLEGIP